VGISEQDIPKLFGKFEQFGRTHGSGIKGTGLGLAISKSLVELHGGKIWVESKINQGTTFHFTLPNYEEVKSEFDRYVDGALQGSPEKQQFVSFLVVYLANFYALQEKQGSKVAIGAMNAVCSAIRQTVTRPSDKFILYQENAVHIILLKTEKEGGLSMIARIKKALKECSFEAIDRDALDLKFGIAVYPIGATDRLSLEKAAYHHLERKKRVLIVDDEPEILRILQIAAGGIRH
jgi:GGDEF domain-containing protein